MAGISQEAAFTKINYLAACEVRPNDLSPQSGQAAVADVIKGRRALPNGEPGSRARQPDLM